MNNTQYKLGEVLNFFLKSYLLICLFFCLCLGVMALKRRIKRKREQKERNRLLSEGSTSVLQNTASEESCSTSLEVLESQ